MFLLIIVHQTSLGQTQLMSSPCSINNNPFANEKEKPLVPEGPLCGVLALLQEEGCLHRLCDLTRLWSLRLWRYSWSDANHAVLVSPGR